MTTDFHGNGYSKTRLICDCVREPTHTITTLLFNSLLVWGYIILNGTSSLFFSVTTDYPRPEDDGKSQCLFKAAHVEESEYSP